MSASSVTVAVAGDPSKGLDGLSDGRLSDSVAKAALGDAQPEHAEEVVTRVDSSHEDMVHAETFVGNGTV